MRQCYCSAHGSTRIDCQKRNKSRILRSSAHKKRKSRRPDSRGHFGYSLYLAFSISDVPSTGCYEVLDLFVGWKKDACCQEKYDVSLLLYDQQALPPNDKKALQEWSLFALDLLKLMQESVGPLTSKQHKGMIPDKLQSLEEMLEFLHDVLPEFQTARQSETGEDGIFACTLREMHRDKKQTWKRASWNTSWCCQGNFLRG